MIALTAQSNARESITVKCSSVRLTNHELEEVETMKRFEEPIMSIQKLVSDDIIRTSSTCFEVFVQTNCWGTLVVFVSWKSAMTAVSFVG